MVDISYLLVLAAVDVMIVCRRALVGGVEKLTGRRFGLDCHAAPDTAEKAPSPSLQSQRHGTPPVDHLLRLQLPVRLCFRSSRNRRIARESQEETFERLDCFVACLFGGATSPFRVVHGQTNSRKSCLACVGAWTGCNGALGVGVKPGTPSMRRPPPVWIVGMMADRP
jgi:hypothetical protein